MLHHASSIETQPAQAPGVLLDTPDLDDWGRGKFYTFKRRDMFTIGGSTEG